VQELARIGTGRDDTYVSGLPVLAELWHADRKAGEAALALDGQALRSFVH